MTELEPGVPTADRNVDDSATECLCALVDVLRHLDQPARHGRATA